MHPGTLSSDTQNFLEQHRTIYPLPAGCCLPWLLAPVGAPWVLAHLSRQVCDITLSSGIGDNNRGGSPSIQEAPKPRGPPELGSGQAGRRQAHVGAHSFLQLRVVT